MPKDLTEIRKLGTCRINFGGRDMGYTTGGVEVTITTEYVMINVDEFGTVPVDACDVGVTIEAMVPLAQPSLNNYIDAFPVGRNSPTDRLTFGRTVGDSVTKKRLVLDPVNETDGFVIYKAACLSVDPLGYNNEGIRILGCHFQGFADDTRSSGDYLFRIFGGMS